MDVPYSVKEINSLKLINRLLSKRTFLIQLKK